MGSKKPNAGWTLALMLVVSGCAEQFAPGRQFKNVASEVPTPTPVSANVASVSPVGTVFDDLTAGVEAGAVVARPKSGDSVFGISAKDYASVRDAYKNRAGLWNAAVLDASGKKIEDPISHRCKSVDDLAFSCNPPTSGQLLEFSMTTGDKLSNGKAQVIVRRFLVSNGTIVKQKTTPPLTEVFRLSATAGSTGSYLRCYGQSASDSRCRGFNVEGNGAAGIRLLAEPIPLLETTPIFRCSIDAGNGLAADFLTTADHCEGVTQAKGQYEMGYGFLPTKKNFDKNPGLKVLWRTWDNKNGRRFDFPSSTALWELTAMLTQKWFIDSGYYCNVGSNDLVVTGDVTADQKRCAMALVPPEGWQY